MHSPHCRNIIFKPLQSVRKLRIISQPYSSQNIAQNVKSEIENVSNETEKNGARINEVNIQMVSHGIYEHIFGKQPKHKPDAETIKKCRLELSKHGVDLSESQETIQPSVDFPLPPLQGMDIEEHFQNISEQQSGPYRKLLLELLEPLPVVPKEWVFQPGWTCYGDNGPEPIPFPPDDSLVFDIEVCIKQGPLPTMTCAASNKYWYSWCSESLMKDTATPMTNPHLTLEHLIPLESTPLEQGTTLSDERLHRKRVVVGHNVSYDRARVKEQYWLNGTGLRFMDTMSLHICVSGVTSYQRAMLKSSKEPSDDDMNWMAQSSLNSLTEVHKLYCGTEVDKEARDVFVNGSLEDVRGSFQQLMTYCAGDVAATHRVLCQVFPMFLERFPHPATLAGMLEIGTAYLPVNSNWPRYIMESDLTYEDMSMESRLLLSKRANQACQLMHNMKYKQDLWMWNEDWSTQNIKMKKKATQKKKTEVKGSRSVNNIQNNINVDNELVQNAGKVDKVDSFVNSNSNEDLENDVDKLTERFLYLFNFESLLPARRPLLPGYPNWYRKLCDSPHGPDWSPGPNNISTSMQIAPKLLRLSWEGYPLHYIRKHGWGFLVPYRSQKPDLGENDLLPELPLEQLIARCPVVSPNSLGATEEQSHAALGTLWKDVQDNLSKKDYYRRVTPDKTEGLYKGTGVWCNLELEGCVWFLKLPHKDGTSHNVGNPLARDFLNKFAENVLAGDDQSAEKVIAIARMLSYWRNNRDRIKQQMVVWLKKENLPIALQNLDMEIGAILPQVVVCGTLTRRAMEATWLTASNARLDRIGSELRAMVQAPPGYSLVGADVDSQELWIASVIGDSGAARTHGATPFGWMTLSGSKAQGTDMHSVTAKAVGISRDHAKVINYARIYGAGQNFAERLLKQFNPTMSETEARSKALKMFTMTKGNRVYLPRNDLPAELEWQNGTLHGGYTAYRALKMAAAHGKSVEEFFQKPRWRGGSESDMFNQLEDIAGSATPVTPFLRCRLSRALEPVSSGSDRFLPTRVNWVVQSGAVDFLHLMLVSMRHLMGPTSQARFCLSFHDEVRYLVPNEYKYRAALAMHITNLMTRAFCSHRLGIFDLPQSVAFFTSVEVDSVLRKDALSDCTTPSNPRGLHAGYGVPPGEALDVTEALQKAQMDGVGLWYLSERHECGNEKTEPAKTHPT